MRHEENKAAYRINSVDFTSIIAATTIVMGLIGGIRPLSQNFDTARQQQLDQHDWDMLDLTLQIYRRVENQPFGKIASQSKRVLERLTQFRDPRHKPEETEKIVIPFFGTITVQRGAFRSGSEGNSPGSYTEAQVPPARLTTLLSETTSDGANLPMTTGSTLPSHGSGYNSNPGSQIAYNGVYLQNSPYYNSDSHVKDGTSSMLDYLPSSNLALGNGWQNVGTFDLDQDWNWDMTDIEMSPSVHF
jgi:hypothetical protein